MSVLENLLKDRCLYVPRMGEGSIYAFIAAFKSVGIDASVVPPSDERTLELSSSHFSGDECYPAHVVFGDFLKVIERTGPDKVAFFLPTSDGPCRFGRYSHYLKQVLQNLGYDQVPIISPSCVNGYDGIVTVDASLLRTGWRAIVTSDILQRILLSVRPYERNAGDADAAYDECLEDLCQVLSLPGLRPRKQLQLLIASLQQSRERMLSVPVVQKELPVIGIVGEIFCRLNAFSNQDAIRRIESHGAECWLSGVPEWLAYANWTEQEVLRNSGKRFSWAMGKARIKGWIQHRDEEALVEPFRNDLKEEAGLEELLQFSKPYLPASGALGEMVLSVGKTIYLWSQGASGVIDISPFSCMNGIVCQAVYPRISDDHDGIPIRVFYFDKSQKNLDQDISIFMDLVRTYRERHP